MSTVAMFTKNIVETHYDSFSTEVIEATKKQILDTLASIVAGSMSKNIGQLVDFTEEAIRDPKALAMAQKVIPRLDLMLAHIPSTEPAVVDIKTRDGKAYSKRIDAAPGSPEDPMSFDDIAEKFRECCRYSAKPVPPEHQDKVIEMVERLEGVSDIGRIASFLG